MPAKSVITCALFFLAILAGHSQNGAASLFNGATLAGWSTVKPGNAKFWTARDSMIVGGDGTVKIPENTFLHTVKEYQDFEFRCLFRLTGDPATGMINSGIQYRSVIEGGHLKGYQADIGNGYWGDIYDEDRRALLVKGDLSTLRHILQPEGWNSYIIRCQGRHHETYINGVKVADYWEEDASIPSKGVIGIQLHSGGAAMVEFRDVTITEL